jgi:hypothetical protein
VTQSYEWLGRVGGEEEEAPRRKQEPRREAVEADAVRGGHST